MALKKIKGKTVKKGSKEELYKKLQETLSEKTYRYHCLNPETNLMEVRVIQGDKLTEEDIHHFLKNILTEWNRAPIQAKVSFTARMFPAMKVFLKKYDEALLMALLHDEPEGEPKN